MPVFDVDANRAEAWHASFFSARVPPFHDPIIARLILHVWVAAIKFQLQFLGETSLCIFVRL